MFFDIGWPELMLIGVVALVVIGPKDLPAALRVAGYWVRKARTMSRELQSHFDQMVREAELDEVRQELKKVTDINLDHEVNKIMDPVTDPAVAGAAQTVPKPPDVPDYVDETPAPADPLPVPEIIEPVPQPVSLDESPPEPVPAAKAPSPEAEPAHIVPPKP